MPGTQVRRSWNTGEITQPINRSFQIRGSYLRRTEVCPLPDAPVHRLVLGTARNTSTGKKAFLIKGLIDSEVGISESFRWKDGKDFFKTSTSHLRHLMERDTSEPHISIIKWRNKIAGVPSEKIIWESIWKSYREEKVNHFMWQIVYQAFATQHYVGRRSIIKDDAGNIIPFSRADPRWWCVRCPNGAHEDFLHCLWSCPKSEEIWGFIEELMLKARGDLSSQFQISAAQALLGAPITGNY